MKLGVDVSTYLDERDAKARYYADGREVDPLLLFRQNNVSLMRLRVWNDPYSEDGKPFLGGTNSVARDIEIIHRTKKYGYQYIIDFHYSDFWVDPAKQTLPKAWKDLSFEELKEAVYQFTKDSLLKFDAIGVEIPYVQIGNEITNGIMWPHGQIVFHEGDNRSNYDNYIALIKAGIKGAKEALPNTKIIIHLEKSNDYLTYEDIFSHLENAHVEYDIIGMSYYPYWHGKIDELFFNINRCRNLFHKNVMVMELGFAFTLEDYVLTNNGLSELKVTKENLEAEVEFDITPEGQAEFISHFVKKAVDEDIEGVIYWEPLWIPGDNVCWSSVEGQAYIHEEGKPTRNEWSNQCLFDYQGNKLPAFDKYKI